MISPERGLAGDNEWRAVGKLDFQSDRRPDCRRGGDPIHVAAPLAEVHNATGRVVAPNPNGGLEGARYSDMTSAFDLHGKTAIGTTLVFLDVGGAASSD